MKWYFFPFGSDLCTARPLGDTRHNGTKCETNPLIGAFAWGK